VAGLSIDFAQTLFRVWLQEKDIQNVSAALKRSGVESKLMVCVLLVDTLSEHYFQCFMNLLFTEKLVDESK